MIKKVCNHCGSENVWMDANAHWDVEKQKWVLLDTFPNEWCDDCEAETSIIDEEELDA